MGDGVGDEDGDRGDLEGDSCWMTSEMKEDDRVMQVREGLCCGSGGGNKPNHPPGTCLTHKRGLFDTSCVSTANSCHKMLNVPVPLIVLLKCWKYCFYIAKKKTVMEMQLLSVSQFLF